MEEEEVKEEAEGEFKFREGEELARRIREATNHGLGVSVVGRRVRWKVEEVCEGGEPGRRNDNRGGRGRGVPSGAVRRAGWTAGRAYGRLQTRGATCFMTSVHHIAPVS